MKKSMEKAIVLWSNISDFKYCEEQVEKVCSITKSNCLKYKFEDDRTRHITGQLLAEYGLYNFFGKHTVSEIIYKNGSKPHYLRDGLNLDFNISHSSNVVVCAFSFFSIGIDVEKDEGEMLPISNRFFKEEENKFISDSSEPNKAAYTMWVLKESYLKAEGIGIGRLGNIPSLVDMHGDICAPNKYNYHILNIMDNYYTAVCTMKDVVSIDVKKVKMKSLIKFLESLKKE